MYFNSVINENIPQYMKLVDVFDIFPLKYHIVHSIKVIYQHKMTNELMAINNMIRSMYWSHNNENLELLYFMF